MPTTNTIRTRIQSKYDTLTNWNNSAFIPLRGEICIAEIPTGAENSGLSPYAIGIKVGDGTHVFNQLPWIQAIAGDVYDWAKASTKPTYTGSEITATRKNAADLTDESKWTHPSIEAWLQSLTNEIDGLSGGAGSISTQIANALADLDVDNDANSSLANHITGFAPGKTLATLTETNGFIDATFQDIAITKNQVSGLGTAASANVATTSISDTSNTNDLTTKAQVKSYVESQVAGLSGAMHYRGSVAANPTVTAPTATPAYTTGDVVTFNHSEYVFDGTNWRELGTEGDYAVKGSISKTDLTSNLQTEISNKVDKESGKGLSTNDYTNAEKTKLAGIAAQAQVNVIEEVQVNGTALAITNKAVNIEVPTTADITNAINGLDSSVAATTATNDEYSVLTGVTQTNGKLTNKTEVKLAKIAKTGSIYDVTEGSNTTVTGGIKYLILDCGSAQSIID